MANPNTSQITESISSLRAETSPDSVTPERVGTLLQAIVDLIKALSNVPEEEVVNVMAAVNQANSNAATALATANAAALAAAAQAIASFLPSANAQGVTLTIKQVSHGNGAGIELSLPIADASHAGIVLPATLQAISDAAAAASNVQITQLTLTYASDGVTWGVRSNAASLSKRINVATTTKAGMMSADDKTKLDSLPSNGYITLDNAGRVPAGQAPQVMIRNVADTTGYWDEHPLQPGDFWFEAGHVWYHASNEGSDIDMGVPSKNVVYCHVDTNILYRWNGSSFVPALTDPNYAMQVETVSRNNNTQMVYNVPNGKLAKMHVTTSAVNVALTDASNGASVHRIIFDADDFSDSCTAINWPSGLVWRNNVTPVAQDVTDCSGIMVTIYDKKWAEFNTYGR